MMFNQTLQLFAVVVFLLLSVSNGYALKSLVKLPVKESSALFAHHPEFKIVRKMMKNRPKKHRLSDIIRKNVNLGKCINKVENAPPEYILKAASEHEQAKLSHKNFWENGDSEAEWIEITAEDMLQTLPTNIEPLPVGGVPKRLPLVRSGTC